jgi:hypothetical protein
MNLEHDPLQEPLRLLRETSLPAGFEEQLAERLAHASRHDGAKVTGRRGRVRLLLLAAAVAIPAAAAGYYAHQKASVTSTQDVAKPRQPVPLEVVRSRESALPSGWTAPSSLAASTESMTEKQVEPERTHHRLPVRRSSNSERTETLPTEPAASAPAPMPPSPPHIETLDPFETHPSSTKSSTSLPKPTNASEDLRKATENDTARTERARSRTSERGPRDNETRSSGAAQPSRERVQTRERRGQ